MDKNVSSLRFTKITAVATVEKLLNAMLKDNSQVGIAFANKSKSRLLVLTANPAAIAYCSRIPFKKTIYKGGGQKTFEIPADDPASKQLFAAA